MGDWVAVSSAGLVLRVPYGKGNEDVQKPRRLL